MDDEISQDGEELDTGDDDEEQAGNPEDQAHDLLPEGNQPYGDELLQLHYSINSNNKVISVSFRWYPL